MLGSLLSASARIAATRTDLFVLPSCTVASVSISSALICASCSLANARWMTGSISSSAPRCSSFAAASRVTRSSAASFSAAMAVASSRRTRLLSTTSSRVSGNGSTDLPVSEIDRHVALDLQRPFARGLHFAVQQRLQQGKRAAIAAGDDPGDGLDLRLVLAEGKIADELRRDRLRPGRHERDEQGNGKHRGDVTTEVPGTDHGGRPGQRCNARRNGGSG